MKKSKNSYVKMLLTAIILSALHSLPISGHKQPDIVTFDWPPKDENIIAMIMTMTAVHIWQWWRTNKPKSNPKNENSNQQNSLVKKLNSTSTSHRCSFRIDACY